VRRALIALAVITAVRLAVAATTGVVEDEAYYWAWSERLAAGYLDHPPGIAWLIAPARWLFGNTSLGARFTCVLAGALAIVPLLRWAKDPALLVLLLGGMPLFTLGGVLATPDVPLAVGWALALDGAFAGRWVQAGIGAGLAGLGKYTGWGLWPLFVLACPRELPRMLPGMLATGLLLSPNLWWNAAHDWASVRFQFDHGLAQPQHARPLEFVLAQVGLVSPLLFAALAWWWRRLPADRVDRVCWMTSAPVLGFFTLASFRGPGEPNWAAMAYMGGMVGLARQPRPVAWVAGGLAAILSALVLVHLRLPLVDIPRDPTARLGLGRDLAQSVQAWGAEPVLTSRYQEAALLHFYEGLDTWSTQDARPNQYAFWAAPWREAKLFVRPSYGGAPRQIEARCQTVSGGGQLAEQAEDGTVLAQWQVFELTGCR
jgi:4-amino-4-deoxy-L-arabinose transferase-like glycosyltransferase